MAKAGLSNCLKICTSLNIRMTCTKVIFILPSPSRCRCLLCVNIIWDGDFSKNHSENFEKLWKTPLKLEKNKFKQNLFWNKICISWKTWKCKRKKFGLKFWFSNRNPFWKAQKKYWFWSFSFKVYFQNLGKTNSWLSSRNVFEKLKQIWVQNFGFNTIFQNQNLENTKFWIVIWLLKIQKKLQKNCEKNSKLEINN